MPIYEFHCADCNVLFNFFSPRVETRKRPDCPRCGRQGLERRPARFATLTRSGDAGSDDPLDQLDDQALGAMMESMAGELDTLGDSEDPRHYASVLRKMGQATGLELGPKMEEILGRLEAGVALEDLERELEAMDGDGDPEGEELGDYFRLKKKLAALARRPEVDGELYFL